VLALSLNPTAKQNFDAVTYTGNGGTQSVTGLAFQPDFIWCKTRSNAVDHKLADSVRGFTKILESNQTRAEVTDTNAITAVGSTGFTLGSGGDYNSNGRTYVAWCWKAGGALRSSNTDGTLTSSVSANTTYGFSVGTYTGSYSSQPTSLDTVGHGLGAVPALIISKSKSGASNWHVWHSSLANNEYIRLNSGDAKATASSGAGGSIATAPTSTVFPTYYIGGSNNGSSDNLVFYCWSEVAGFSKFGSYTGNGSSTGPVVTTGFKPRLLMVKGSSHASNWNIVDTARSPSNPQSNILRANSSAAEFSTPTGQYGLAFDALDDGFQLKSGSSTNDVNQTGETYIYAAFAASIPGDPDNDSLVDTPSNAADPTDTGAGGEVTGNYATLNPLAKASGLGTSNGNLDASGSAIHGCVASTIFAHSGKYYCEYTLTAYQNDTAVGVVSTDVNTSEDWVGEQSYTVGYLADGRVFQNASATTYDSYSAGDVIGVAFDADTGKVWFAKNNSWLNSGNPSAGTNEVKTITGGKPLGVAFRGVGGTGSFNFGQRQFAFSAPTNFQTLNTASLPTPTIADGSKYFDTKLFTGTGSTQALTMANSALSPDFVWIKNRNSTYQHLLFDAVRGATKYLKSDATSAEQTNGSTLASFDSNGFTLGGDNEINRSSYTYASWAWDAGDSNTTIAASSLNSSSYNQSAVWSGMFSPAVSTSGQETRAFDGTIGAQGGYLNGGGSWVPTGGLTYYSTVEVYDAVDQKYAINGGTQSAIALNQWVTIASTSNSSGATLTSIDFTRISSASTTHTPAGIRIDGKLLVDQGVSVTNLPSIASTVRANPSAGFSIVTYTGNGTGGATFGHGLNADLGMCIIACRNTTNYWDTWHSGYYVAGSKNYIRLQSTAAAGYASDMFGTPTSSVVTLGSSGSMNGSGNTYVAYCFAPVEGYSAMGSYEGLGTAGGAFVFLGFRPALLIVKDVDGTWDWYMYDAVRNTYNVVNNVLRPSGSNAEESHGTNNTFDFLSNGFKVRGSTSQSEPTNYSGHTYIYYAVSRKPVPS